VADISRRAYPADHPHRLMSLHNLAVGYATLGRFADARPVGEEVLAARRRLLPPGHEDTLRSLITQIGILGSLDRHDDALALGREALDGARKALPPDHPLTLSVEHNIGVSYERLGRFADALPVFRRVLAARRRLLPATHPDVLKSVGSVATTLVALGRGAEALPLIDECVAGAAGQSVSPRLLPPVLTARLHHFRATGDPAGCRATADLWDKLNRTDADSLVVAARMRAVTAGAFAAADQPPDAAAEADRAMGRLTQAVAAGLRDRGRIEADADLAYLRHRADFHALVCPLPYIAPPPRPVW
jgi:tetratricopeptide (TPR) repeat protein